MTGLLSAISGQFSKSLLLSTLLTVVVFVLLAVVLVLPWVPPSVTVLQWVQDLDAEWRLAVVMLAVLVLSALLYNLNGPIIRFYEGYPWCDSYLGRWRAAAYRRRLASRDAQWRGLRILVRQEETKRRPGYDDILDFWSRLGRELNTLYPDRPGTVLPTRLGNVIRSFESYPLRQYKIRGIALWPRLISKLSEGYAAQIGDVKSSFDFMLNASSLCGLLAVLVAGIHLVYPAGLATPEVLVPAVVQVLALLGLAYGFYLAAISRASAWGLAVKGAFDLYRLELLESLGYRQRPESLEEERALWESISLRLILTDLSHVPHPGYDKAAPAPPTSARAEPQDIPLQLARGASLPAEDGGLTIRVRVRNADPARAAHRVIVVEALPDGWLYEWQSATTATGPVQVVGANPYHFQIGAVGPRGEALLTYRMIPIERRN